MIFNFFLGNHHANSLNNLGDLVEPIHRGLEACGHHVVAFGTGMVGAPAVNVFVEFFEDDAVAEAILSAKAQHGDGFIFGIVCTEDIEDDLVMNPRDYPRRRANLMRLLPQADFVWTLLPLTSLYESICGPGKVALIDYGFTEACRDRWPILDPGLRDVDVIVYGNENPYRAAVGGELRRQGLTVFFGHRETYPNFVTDDIIRRSKVLLDIRRGPGVRFLSPTRIVKGLHAGTAVVSELFDTSPISNLYRYTTACSHDDMAARTIELIRTGEFVAAGQSAQTKFKAETSMQASMARAIALPVFARLAGLSKGAPA